MMMCGRPTAGDLLKQAKCLQYTNNGEMFSARNLLDLVKRNLIESNIKAKNPETIRAYLYDGPLDTDFIQVKLKNHCLLLVPYDADRNHSPCFRNGAKAHWCLIVGYLIDENDDVSSVNACFAFRSHLLTYTKFKKKKILQGLQTETM